MTRYLILFLSAAILSCSPLKKYESLPEVVSWEDDIRQFEKIDSAVSYPDDAVLFTGSSSIRLWSTLEKDMAPYNVIQRGYGGARLSDYVVYADRIVRPHKCSSIVIFIANDITGSPEDKTPGQVADLFRILLKQIRKSHRDTPVFWIEVTPTPSRWKVWPRIKEAGQLIENICRSQKNTYFIKTEQAFINDNGVPDEKYFVEDKLHLSGEGYALWTGIIRSELGKVVNLYGH